MTRCAICDDDLDGKPECFGSAESLIAVGVPDFDARRWLGASICLTCGVLTGGTWDGITLTHDGLMEAVRRIGLVAAEFNRIREDGLTADQIRAKYADHLEVDA